MPILKGPDRDMGQPKSYRPVSLLPVLGKVLEKAMNQRLQEQTSANLTGRQYGFIKGRSTTDAIERLMTWSAKRPEKYVLTIFLDITGAFNNLAWPALQQDLADLGASPHMRKWIANYLTGRTATMTIGGVTKTIRVTKGCPQGSILGPILWNVTMEAILRVELPTYATIQAYADDIAISVAGPTRASLVRRAEQALIPATDWARSRGLSFSPSKSQAMVTKGDLVPGFTVGFGNDRIVSVDKVKYLGIWLDPCRSFKIHLEKLLNMELALFSRLRGVAGSGWGIRKANLTLLYRGVFLPKLSYGVQFWVHVTETKMAEKKLGSLQRCALLGMTCAYKTTSTPALQVLAGIPPLDLELQLLAVKAQAKNLPERLRLATVNSAQERLLEKWQQRWDESLKGRWTHTCFPTIKNRMSLPIALGHEITQFLSGHGNFNAKLAKLGLRPSPRCACGQDDEDVQHVIFDCPLHSIHRAYLELAVLRAGLLWPCTMVELVSRKELFVALAKFAKEAAYLERPQGPV